MIALSQTEARRVALAAQGFARARPGRRIDARHVRRVLGRISLFQIDSVNALARAHYFPLFSRLGPYPRDLLDRLAYAKRELFEYWGHQASLLPIELYPFLRFRMEAARTGAMWPRFARWAEASRDVVSAVEQEVAERGPIGVSDLPAPGERSGPWWGWSDGKTALEWLYTTGRVAVAGRRNFERLYDLTERVVPPELLNGAAPGREASIAELVRRSLGALGVATVKDVGDYFGIKVATVRPFLEAMVADGFAREATVEGWPRPVFLDAAAKPPRAIDAHALV